MNSLFSAYPGLTDVVAEIPVFAGLLNITLIKEGLTNNNFRVDTSTATYLLRISDPATAALGIDRENEKINTRRACEAGVSPALIDELPAEQVLVIQWIFGQTLTPEDLRNDQKLLEKIATAIRKLHQGPGFEGVFYFPTIRKQYLQLVQEKNYFIPEQYLDRMQQIIALEDILALHPEALVPCNNDLLAANFINDGHKIWIIDYEYAGQNEASFEIGNLASESGLNDQQLSVLCDAYWQRHSPGKIARAQAWSMIARYGWVLWASIQEAISPIQFQFRSWGLQKWNSLLTDLDGERYRSVLNQLNNLNE